MVIFMITNTSQQEYSFLFEFERLHFHFVDQSAFELLITNRQKELHRQKKLLRCTRKEMCGKEYSCLQLQRHQETFLLLDGRAVENTVWYNLFRCFPQAWVLLFVTCLINEKLFVSDVKATADLHVPHFSFLTMFLVLLEPQLLHGYCMDEKYSVREHELPSGVMPLADIVADCIPYWIPQVIFQYFSTPVVMGIWGGLVKFRKFGLRISSSDDPELFSTFRRFEELIEENFSGLSHWKDLCQNLCGYSDLCYVRLPWNKQLKRTETLTAAVAREIVSRLNYFQKYMLIAFSKVVQVLVYYELLQDWHLPSVS